VSTTDQAELLAETTHLLSSVFEYPRVLDELTGLCVRAMADWAFIDVEQDGEMKRLTRRHRDSHKQALLEELERYPFGFGSPVVDVIHRREPRLFAELDDGTLRKYSLDPEHADLIRRLGTGSGMVVPLIARGLQLGVLALVSEAPGHYTRVDLALAEELARRAALVIDNARHLEAESRALRRLTRVALAVKDMANSPLQTLTFDVELLARTSGVAEQILDRMARALDRLKELDAVLAHYTPSVELQPGDEAFDAVEILRESAPSAPRSEEK
jgi:GAF domain-containing protein